MNAHPSFNPENIGWDPPLEQAFQDLGLTDTVPARVISQEKSGWMVAESDGDLPATIPGKLLLDSGSGALFPTVGDWVALEILPDCSSGLIRAVLPRRSALSRQAAGGRERLSGGKVAEQVLAANIDVVFIVNALDGGRSFNLRRIERYLALAWQAGAVPVILLNKADLCPSPAAFVRNVEDIAPGVPVHSVSALQDAGLEPVRNALTGGKTGVFVGPSGVGKSALINTLLGEERQQTGNVREHDRRGRHTTTRRELLPLPGGGAVIDTPGIRELQLWGSEEDTEAAFPDIEILARYCRFPDCAHEMEPGCAVKEAVSQGEIEIERYENYLKLRRELRFQAARETEGARRTEKARWKHIAKAVRQVQKFKGGE